LKPQVERLSYPLCL